MGGNIFAFVCTSCGTNHYVGTEECEFEAMRLVWCAECQALREAAPPSASDPNEQSGDVCVEDATHRVVPWALGHPCPGCGGEVAFQGVAGLWD